METTLSPEKYLSLDKVTTVPELERLIVKNGPWLVDPRWDSRHLIVEYFYRMVGNDRELDLMLAYIKEGIPRRARVATLSKDNLFLLRGPETRRLLYRR